MCVERNRRSGVGAPRPCGPRIEQEEDARVNHVWTIGVEAAVTGLTLAKIGAPIVTLGNRRRVWACRSMCPKSPTMSFAGTASESSGANWRYSFPFRYALPQWEDAGRRSRNGESATRVSRGLRKQPSRVTPLRPDALWVASMDRLPRTPAFGLPSNRRCSDASTRFCGRSGLQASAAAYGFSPGYRLRSKSCWRMAD